VRGGVLSGYSNFAGDAAADTGATVCGGYDNAAMDTGCFVGGGRNNTASCRYATVGGGYGNDASERYATVAGGVGNSASDRYATVGGGTGNTASGFETTVAGGTDNDASASGATVAGGYYNTASGDYATVCGGHHNDATASGSFAANTNSNAYHDNSAAFNSMTTTGMSQLRCGAISKTGGTFTIDHPLQPMSTILNHYFVESPDMSNIYSGSAVLDGAGRAEVQLPDYFDALNRNPRVQLTGVGSPDVYVARDISGNSFAIGGPAGTKVYWQVTGDRKDQSAEAIRLMMPVEQQKTGKLAGHSLDDDFLSGAMKQLEEMGHAGEFQFRTTEGRQQYEESLRPPEQK